MHAVRAPNPTPGPGRGTSVVQSRARHRRWWWWWWFQQHHSPCVVRHRQGAAIRPIRWPGRVVRSSDPSLRLLAPDDMMLAAAAYLIGLLLSTGGCPVSGVWTHCCCQKHKLHESFSGARGQRIRSSCLSALPGANAMVAAGAALAVNTTFWLFWPPLCTAQCPSSDAGTFSSLEIYMSRSVIDLGPG